MKASDYFFTYKTEGIPKEIASGLFTPSHLLALLIVAAAITILLLIFRKKSEKARRRFIIFCAFSLAFSELVRIVWVLIRIGYTTEDILPLHLCGLMLVFMPLAVLTKKKFLYEFIYACGLAGAAAALLTPDVSIYPALHFQYIQSFFTHGMIVFIPTFLIVAEDFRPNYKYIPKVLLLLVSMLPIVYVLNLLTDSNFFFLMSAPPGTIIEIFDKWVGYPAYILLLLATTVVLWVILYLPWMIAGWINKKEKKQESIEKTEELVGVQGHR